MQTVPQVQPITNMQQQTNHVVSLLENGPVFLTQSSETTAVLVQPAQWDRLIRELENHRLLAESRRISARNDANDSWINGDEMDRRMIERGIVTASETGGTPVVQTEPLTS